MDADITKIADLRKKLHELMGDEFMKNFDLQVKRDKSLYPHYKIEDIEYHLLVSEIGRLQSADTDTDHMLTESERNVIDKLAESWNLFLALPIQHPLHQSEFATLIHHAQRMVMSRPVARVEGWVKE